MNDISMCVRVRNTFSRMVWFLEIWNRIPRQNKYILFYTLSEY